LQGVVLVSLVQMTIDGRKASVAYLDDDFEPVDPDAATLMKVVFDDGEMAFLTIPEDEERSYDIEKAEWDESEHPRDPDGKFTTGGGGGAAGGELSTEAPTYDEPVQTGSTVTFKNSYGQVKSVNVNPKYVKGQVGERKDLLELQKAYKNPVDKEKV